MPRILVIVESPTKATIIQRYLRELDPDNDYIVLASFGHIRDLPKDGIAVDAQTLDVTYVAMKDKSAVIKKLRDAAKTADRVLLAADADREGESIAWHVAQVLKLPKKRMARMTFTEITKPALQKALTSLRSIDMALVMAQQTRRVLDRVVGYRVSPMLWREPMFAGMRGLSAGRVQSAALHLIVTRETEREKSLQLAGANGDGHWTVYASFVKDMKDSMELELDTTWVNGNFISPDKIQAFYSSLPRRQSPSKTHIYEVTNVTQKTTTEAPPQPFTTCSLQQTAVKMLKMNAKEVMKTAQRLYEGGHITYMRTDSTVMSPEAKVSVGDYICKTWGKEFAVSTTHVDSKAKKSAKRNEKHVQGAHECIRPTRFDGPHIAINDEAGAQLYKLIFDRTIQSQMKPVIYDETTITVWKGFVGVISVMAFAGWRMALGQGGQGNDLQNNVTLLNIKKGDSVKLTNMIAKWTRTPLPSPFTEASMIKTLEANGIGRPSTFASTLEVLYARKYVDIDDVVTSPARKVVDYKLDQTTYEAVPVVRQIAAAKISKALIPTELGKRVDTFLTRRLPDLVSADFTAQMENELDEIAKGNMTYENVVRGVCTRLGLTI